MSGIQNYIETIVTTGAGLKWQRMWQDKRAKDRARGATLGEGVGSRTWKVKGQRSGRKAWKVMEGSGGHVKKKNKASSHGVKIKLW